MSEGLGPQRAFAIWRESPHALCQADEGRGSSSPPALRAPLRAFLVLTLIGCGSSSPVPAEAGPPIDGGAERDASAPTTDASATDGSTGETDAGGAEPCTSFGAPGEAGRVAPLELDELSGLAAGRDYPGRLYAINDSGDRPRVFILGLDGSHAATIELEGASHRDYEDLAVGPGPEGDGSWVYVGDIGDNNARTGSGTPRDEITIYRFREPELPDGAAPTTVTVRPDAITVVYPGPPHDCESLAVDPSSGDLFILTKEDSAPSTWYVARSPLAARVTLEAVTEIDFGSVEVPGGRQATAMDLSPSGRALLVRSYDRVHLWLRAAAQTWEQALAAAPLSRRGPRETQGEAVAWSRDGRSFYTASEGRTPILYQFAAEPLGCEAF